MPASLCGPISHDIAIVSLLYPIRRRVNREVQTVNREAGKKGGCRDRCQEGPEEGAQTVNQRHKWHTNRELGRGGLNREVQTANWALSTSKIPGFQFTMCTSWFMPP